MTFWLSGKNWVRIDQSPVAPAPTSPSEGRDLELKGKHRATLDTKNVKMCRLYIVNLESKRIQSLT